MPFKAYRLSDAFIYLNQHIICSDIMSDTSKVRAVIVDGDNTLWRGRAAEGIGKAYLLRELKRLNLPTFYRGYKGAKEVMAIVKEVGGVEGEIKGQKRFYEVLVENGLGTKEGM